MSTTQKFTKIDLLTARNSLNGPSFSFKNRVGRLIWWLVCLLFFRYTPKNFHVWRRAILRLFGAQIGRKCHIYPKARIWAPWNLKMEDESSIADGSIIYSQDLIHIGFRTIISQGVHICAGTHDHRYRGFPLITKPIYIGDWVWIAAEAFIHPGVSIGDGCVIGARSVVTKNMPKWMVCSGFPCEPLKPRIFLD
ncbi:DapH/DapD/GlmU-related protein [Algoriphagus chordae]|uniref:Putative colanic acid biosynthesis acetyltransferase WcaF n=1 Tax=Algoriphagus chordae TaxID=237019 RepID=A0A2W7R8R8_9BACT|nr:DapH/DapD/GlmU-related protein [Algoriphagus chordae]PZX52077.1 putative colanic acid biosynthesis acetyltransferase WcaF [Algoriphagus chordae]